MPEPRVSAIGLLPLWSTIGLLPLWSTLGLLRLGSSLDLLPLGSTLVLLRLDLLCLRVIMIIWMGLAALFGHPNIKVNTFLCSYVNLYL